MFARFEKFELVSLFESFESCQFQCVKEATLMEPDPAFEYDAPTYMDFNLLRQGKIEDDGVDAWFGKRQNYWLLHLSYLL